MSSSPPISLSTSETDNASLGGTGYTSDILTDSLLYAEHARSGAGGNTNQPLNPSIDDIRLAVQARTESASVPKEVSAHSYVFLP